MGYCPKCDDEKDGDLQWHRSCAMAVFGALLLKSIPDDAYRHYPNE